MQILKSILLWLFLPIHFFFFTKKRGLLNKWIALLLSIISPVSLIFWIILFITIILCHSDYQRKYHYTRRSVLKEIIGVKLPKYKVVKRELGEIGFNRDYQDCFYLEFNEPLDSIFIHQLDSLVNNGKGRKYDKTYNFYMQNQYVNVGINPDDNTMVVTASEI